MNGGCMLWSFFCGVSRSRICRGGWSELVLVDFKAGFVVLNPVRRSNLLNDLVWALPFRGEAGVEGVGLFRQRMVSYQYLVTDSILTGRGFLRLLQKSLFLVFPGCLVSLGGNFSAGFRTAGRRVFGKAPFTWPAEMCAEEKLTRGETSSCVLSVSEREQDSRDFGLPVPVVLTYSGTKRFLDFLVPPFSRVSTWMIYGCRPWCD